MIYLFFTISTVMLILSGLWLGSIIVNSVVYNVPSELPQYLGFIVSLGLGLVLLFTTISSITEGVCK